jgi:hypothetical protein
MCVLYSYTLKRTDGIAMGSYIIVACQKDTQAV